MSNNPNFHDLKIDINNKEMIGQIAQYIVENMKQGMTVQQAVGLSDEGMEQIYGLAHSFYTQGKYQEATALFEFLAGSAPRTYKFLLGLASSYHQMGAYQAACPMFLMALNLNEEDPLPAYYATDCCLQQNLNLDAIELAKFTEELCGDRPEYSALKMRCSLIAKSLNDKINNK